jgi:hypothetical protein
LRRRCRTAGDAGRKKDFRDAERLVKWLVAHELNLSFVPDVEQRLMADGRAHQVPADAHLSPAEHKGSDFRLC